MDIFNTVQEENEKVGFVAWRTGLSILREAQNLHIPIIIGEQQRNEG